LSDDPGDLDLLPACGGVVVNDRGELLLREPAGGFGGYAWTWPKGRAEPGEAPEAAALREVLEETGVEAAILFALPGTFDGETTRTRFWLMRHVATFRAPDSTETSRLRWATPGEAERLIPETPSLAGRARDLAVPVRRQVAAAFPASALRLPMSVGWVTSPVGGWMADPADMRLRTWLEALARGRGVGSPPGDLARLARRALLEVLGTADGDRASDLVSELVRRLLEPRRDGRRSLDAALDAGPGKLPAYLHAALANILVEEDPLHEVRHALRPHVAAALRRPAAGTGMPLTIRAGGRFSGPLVAEAVHALRAEPAFRDCTAGGLVSELVERYRLDPREAEAVDPARGLALRATSHGVAQRLDAERLARRVGARLSPRDARILGLLLRGWTLGEIGAEVGLGFRRVAERVEAIRAQVRAVAHHASFQTMSIALAMVGAGAAGEAARAR
jgi:ADP-ribose pyrophosphatase YjhB (NUDIX family)